MTKRVFIAVLLLAAISAACSNKLTSPTNNAGQQNTAPVTPANAAPITVSQALAELTNATDDEARSHVWASMTPELQASVLSALGVKDIKESEDVHDVPSLTAAASCKTVLKTYAAYSIANLNVWNYYEQLVYCYSAGKITSKAVTRWGTVNVPLWAFKGNIGQTTSGGVGSTSFTAWTQGSFALCTPYIVICQNVYPWVSITAYGTGSSSSSAGS